MNTHPANPFTGLKGTLAGLLSGGVMGLLFALLFRRHLALAALERIYDMWRAGTLAAPTAPERAPATRTPRPACAPRASTAPRAPRTRTARPAARQDRVPPAAAPRPAPAPLITAPARAFRIAASRPHRARSLQKPQGTAARTHAYFVTK